MNEDFSTDIIIEALEVFIHHILYTRGIYPPQIFRKRKIYNCPVFVSIYPNVNNYITEILTIARELKTTKELQKLEVVVYQDERLIFEKYVFDISDDCLLAAARSSNDEYLLDFEQQLRTSLYTLSERVKSLEKIPKDAKFKIQLHTTQTGFVKTCCSPLHQSFPWLQVSETMDHNYKETTLLPLSVIDSTGIRIHVQI